MGEGKNGDFTLGASPSTHIIKFEIAGYRHIPIYECFMTEFARSIGFPVVEAQLKKQNGNHFLLIQRYDRFLSHQGLVNRLHQEDFCQALGVSYDRKYEQGGGPSFEMCYRLVQNVSSDPINDVERLLKWQIFNLLAGNSDGHAKNLALLYDQEQRCSLAPFYDLVCTRAIERIDTELALAIGGEFKPDSITRNHWFTLAEQCSVNKTYLINIIKDLADKLVGEFDKTLETFTLKYGEYPMLQRVQKVITKQCKRTLKQLSDAS